jgi:nicotinamidase-related amidase
MDGTTMDLTLEPSRTALVAIDLQRGLAAQPMAPYPVAEVVERTARLAHALRAAGGTVILIRVTPSSDGKDALRPLTDAPPAWSPRPRPADWAEIVPELRPDPGDLVISKRQWGAFYGTELDLQLRRRGIGTIILAGVSTNVGVESTARDAFERDYQQVFVEDAMSARDASEHAHTVRTLFPRIGRVRSTADVLAALQNTESDREASG